MTANATTILYTQSTHRNRFPYYESKNNNKWFLCDLFACAVRRTAYVLIN